MSIFSHPVKKLAIVAAIGAAYVLGAKAGRERYEQIVQAANQVKDVGVPKPTSPLLRDEHIDVEEELVYSAGPDIEESIDELADVDPVEEELLGGQHRDDGSTHPERRL